MCFEGVKVLFGELSFANRRCSKLFCRINYLSQNLGGFILPKLTFKTSTSYDIKKSVMILRTLWNDVRLKIKTLLRLLYLLYVLKGRLYTWLEFHWNSLSRTHLSSKDCSFASMTINESQGAHWICFPHGHFYMACSGVSAASWSSLHWEVML